MQQSISLDLDNQIVIVKEVLIDDINIVNKLRAIGIYSGNKIKIKKVGNMKDMICINANGIDNVIRLTEAKKIIVKRLNNNVKE